PARRASQSGPPAKPEVESGEPAPQPRGYATLRQLSDVSVSGFRKIVTSATRTTTNLNRSRVAEGNGGKARQSVWGRRELRGKLRKARDDDGGDRRRPERANAGDRMAPTCQGGGSTQRTRLAEAESAQLERESRSSVHLQASGLPA